jgi:hypothetical protein
LSGFPGVAAPARRSGTGGVSAPRSAGNAPPIHTVTSEGPIAQLPRPSEVAYRHDLRIGEHASRIPRPAPVAAAPRLCAGGMMPASTGGTAAVDSTRHDVRTPVGA